MGLQVVQSFKRTPKNYDGIERTTHRFSDVLPGVLEKISEVYQERPDLLLAAWPEVIGKKLAGWTQAVSFREGILTVKVQSSTLHSLLHQNDRHKILNTLRERFPRIEIKNVVFCIG